MSFPDPRPPFMPSIGPYDMGSDAIGCWPRFPMNNGDQYSQSVQHGPAFKRAKTTSEESQLTSMFYPLAINAVNSDSIGCWPQFPINKEDQHSQFEQQQKKTRISEEGQSNSLPYPPMITRMIPPNAPVNKGMSNIFFKTRHCAKFKVGMCRNGENCNFAHGDQDIRQPPPNWQELAIRDEDRTSSGNWDDDQKIIHRMKLCKKFYNGEECPYGDRCNFLHEDPSKFRDDLGRFRESAAISIGTTGSPAVNGTSSVHSEDNRPVNTISDPFRPSMKSSWKTKICNKWEITGQCPFGEKCHFAHGQAGINIDTLLYFFCVCYLLSNFILGFCLIDSVSTHKLMFRYMECMCLPCVVNGWTIVIIFRALQF